MLIPIGHDQSIRRWPWVTIGIIVLCTLMQAYSSFGAPSQDELLGRALQIATEYSDDDPPERMAELERRVEALLDEVPMVRFGYRTGSGLSLALITSAFVHGGWLHLIGNMLFLWLAGSALEDRYGRFRFALFYVLGAIAATYAFEATAGKGVLLVGASGAVSACMGAFLLHFHKAQIRFWYLLFYRSGTFYWPAWFALPLWLAEQFLWGSFDGGTGKTTGVAYAAHIGGFAFGFVAGFVMNKLFPVDDDGDGRGVGDAPPPRSSGRLGRASAAELGRPSSGTLDSDAVIEERVDKCFEAIDKRDMATVRTIGPRVIIDLARKGDDGRVLEVYRAMAAKLSKVPLTVQAFAAAAEAADRRADPRTYISIAEAMIAEHPYGLQTPQVMWRLSQLHGDAGNPDLEKQTLRTLAERFPKDEYGQKAARMLET